VFGLTHGPHNRFIKRKCFIIEYQGTDIIWYAQAILIMSKH